MVAQGRGKEKMTRSAELIHRVMGVIEGLDAEHRHESASIVREMVGEYRIAVEMALSLEDTIHRIMKGE